jgi:hypothetical protein
VNAGIKTIAAAAILVTLMLSCLGCTPAYRVQVNGFSDPDYAGRMAPRAKFHVRENPQAENPLFEKEIRLKIEKMLQSKGFIIGNADTADFLCTFQYSVGIGLVRMGSIPVQSPPLASAVTVANPAGTTQTTMIMAPGPTTYVPYARTDYDRWLNIIIKDARSFRETREEKMVWYGDISSAGPSRDLRKVIDYMLIAAFDAFGKDTKQGILSDIKEDDARIKIFLLD